MDKILLKGIFINHLSTRDVIEDIKVPETIIETDQFFWEELEKTSSLSLERGNEEITEKTELACWSCGLFFEESPWGIPVFSSSDIEPTTAAHYELHHNLLDSTSRAEKKGTKDMGNFCGVCCAIRFITESPEIPRNLKKIYTNLLYHKYEQMVGRKISYIPPAHPRYKMRIYCGQDGWSEQEYKEKNKQLEKYLIL